MATNQEARQASVRAVTGTAYTHNEDWLALFTAAGITSGTFNDRMLDYLNTQLMASGLLYDNVNDAMRAYAIVNGVTRWDELGTFTPATTGYRVLVDSDGNFLVDSDGAYLIGAA